MNQQVNSSSAAAPYGMAGPNAPLPVHPQKDHLDLICSTNFRPLFLTAQRVFWHRV